MISGTDQAMSKAVEFIAAGQVIEVRPSSVGKSATKGIRQIGAILHAKAVSEPAGRVCD